MFCKQDFSVENKYIYYEDYTQKLMWSLHEVQGIQKWSIWYSAASTY